jgi:hypothetical protein
MVNLLIYIYFFLKKKGFSNDRVYINNKIYKIINRCNNKNIIFNYT